MSNKPGRARVPQPFMCLSRVLLLGVLLFLSLLLRSTQVQAAPPPPPVTTITGNTVTGNFSTQIVPPPAGGHTYGIQGGQTVGTNLFHSFGQFNVGPGDIAQFQTSTLTQNTSISNILGRVNAQQSPSQIFGTIDSATFYPTANLFLMNPFGFLFGPNATVNVGGMVAFTSADYLRLQGVGGNGIFYNDGAQPTILTSAPVAAFGFLGSNPGAITVQGSQLSVTPGQSISLIGGDIAIGADPSTGTPAVLSAPSGQINLASVASPGEVLFPTLQTGPNVAGQSFTSMGNITISDGSQLNVSTLTDADGNPLSDLGGGTIRIRGGQLVMDSALLLANTLGTQDGAPTAVDIAATGDVAIRNSSFIFVSSSGPGQIGDVQISGQNVSLESDSGIATLTATPVSGPAGGNIMVNAKSFSMTGGAFLNTDTLDASNGGNITISASNSFTLSGFDPLLGTQTQILSSTSGGIGKSGSVTISANTATISDRGLVSTLAGETRSGDIVFQADTLTLSNGGQINSQGGNISIGGKTTSIAQDVTITGQFNNSVRSGINSFGGGVVGGGPDTGAGNIRIQTQSLLVTDQGRINSDANGLPGGKIVVSATETVTVSDGGKIRMTGGNGGTMDISSPTVLLDGGALQSIGGPGRDSGPITVNANDLSLLNGGQINSSTLGGTIGVAGPVTIQGFDGAGSRATSVSISGRDAVGNPSGIITTTEGKGIGGAISIMANELSLSDGAVISSATASSTATAAGGAITINADQVTLASGASVTSSSIKQIPGSPNFTPAPAGDAGNLTITGTSVTITGNGTSLSALTEGSGKGGAITVQANQVQIADGAIVSAKSTGSGAAGSVTIQGLASPAQSVLIDGAGSGIFTDTQARGAGGSITTWSNQLQLSNGSTISSKTSGSGNAGNILVKADDITISGGGTITAASTGSGNAGTVTIQGTHSPANSFVVDGFNSGIFTTTQSTGAGGNIFVNANSFTLSNGGTVSAATSGTTPSATGGTITVNANQVQLSSGGLITAATSGTGAGGSININTGSTFASNAGTVSSTATQATGGDINIAAGQSVTLTNGAGISASSSGAGNAGKIQINAGNLFNMTNSMVTTEANHASGGIIKITTSPSGVVQLTDSTISASVLDGSGGGGSVNIDPQFVILQNSQILANAVFGPGGSINITTNLLLPDSTSVISASSQFGQQGTVAIQSPISPASGKIIPLSQKPLIAASLMSQRCAALAGGNFSSFTVAGRDTLPSEPGGWLSSPLALSTSESADGTLREAGLRLKLRTQDPELITVQSPLLSLRQIGPPGFLTQVFAVESSGCQS